MNEEQKYPQEHERRKRNMRPDALVIPDDVLRIMRIPRRDWTAELRASVQTHIQRAKDTLFPDAELAKVPLVFHQQVADKVAALAAVFASTDDEARQRLLAEIIGKARVCARTNYQFVRHFIRRGLYPVLIENGIPVPETWSVTVNVHMNPEPIERAVEPRTDLFSRKYLDDLAGELAKETVNTVKMIVKGLLAYLALEGMGFPVTETLTKLINILIAKGEFEHYDEIKDVLEAIRRTDPDKHSVDMRVLKGTETGWEYVRDGLQIRDIPCVAWAPDRPPIRYYAFPVSHLLLFSLGDEQFLAFSGGDSDAVKATGDLFFHDVKTLAVKV